MKGGEYRQEEGRRTKNDGMNRSAGKRQWELEKLIRGSARAFARWDGVKTNRPTSEGTKGGGDMNGPEGMS